VNAPTLETERLVLRPFTDGDIELLVDAVFSDPDVMKTLPGDTETPEEQAECAKHYTDAYTVAWPEHGYGGWAVCTRTNDFSPTGTLLGFSGFNLGQRAGGLAELGFGYSQSCWGKGVGFEAASAATEWFFGHGGFNEFYACCDSFNDGSKRILEKLGMVYYGDEDLWDSVAQGLGLVPVYTLNRETYFNSP
jgi:RimJ/RimL family protein N-acetyltransferase